VTAAPVVYEVGALDAETLGYLGSADKVIHVDLPTHALDLRRIMRRGCDISNAALPWWCDRSYAPKEVQDE
jgi:hypothetical protein